MNKPSFTPIYFPPITRRPSYIKTYIPSNIPSYYPTQIPTQIHTQIPTQIPSVISTPISTKIPTLVPSLVPTLIPSMNSTNTTNYIIILQLTNKNTSTFQISIIISISIFFIFCIISSFCLYEHYRRKHNEIEWRDWIEHQRINDIKNNILKPIRFYDLNMILPV